MDSPGHHVRMDHLGPTLAADTHDLQCASDRGDGRSEILSYLYVSDARKREQFLMPPTSARENHVVTVARLSARKVDRRADVAASLAMVRYVDESPDLAKSIWYRESPIPLIHSDVIHVHE